MNYTLEQQMRRQAADESGGEINKHIHKLRKRWGQMEKITEKQGEKQTKMAQTENKNKNNNSPQFNLHNDSVKRRL